MKTNIRNGKQTISNNLEYENYTILEEEINNLIRKLNFQIVTPVTGDLIKELEEFEDTLYSMRAEYDKERLKLAVQKNKRRVKVNGK